LCDCLIRLNNAIVCVVSNMGFLNGEINRWQLRLVLDKHAFCDQQRQGGPVCCKWDSAAETHRGSPVPDRVLEGSARFAKKLLAQ
jgi:hypothetical protein